MSVPCIAFGCDSSKGRIDVEVLNDSNTVLHVGAFDDMPEGHANAGRLLQEVHARHPEAIILVGIESTGGLERNWLAMFRRLQQKLGFLRIFRLNASAVHAYRSSQLHKAPGDQAAAHDIARFLLERCRTRTPEIEAEAGPIVLYRTIRSMIEDQVLTSQRLQSLLVSVHPDLVQYCRYGLPNWVMYVLARYPTAAHLARAQVSRLDKIPHVDAQRAAALVDEARKSVASLTDEASAMAMRLSVRRWLSLQTQIEQAQQEFLDLIQVDPKSELAKRKQLLDGIPGIGPWSAACLACEIGDPDRFAHDKAIIAWAGLDPVSECSGDQEHRRGISHRGNAHVRAILFPLAMAGINHNPVLKAFFQRLMSHGKTRLQALVAVMAKLLRIAFAILRTGKPFDPEYEQHRRERQPVLKTPAPELTVQPALAPEPQLHAPISRREANRRKKAAASSVPVRDQGPKHVTDARRALNIPPSQPMPRVS